MIGEQQRKGSGPRIADCGRVIRLVLPPVCRREIFQKMKTHRKQIGNENGNGMDGGVSTYLQSGDSIRKWRDSYSKTCLRSLFQRRRGMKTHIYRKQISAYLLSGHKSGHRASQRAISYSERRVTTYFQGTAVMLSTKAYSTCSYADLAGADPRWLEPKLKPRWDVHLSGDDNQLGLSP